MQWESWLKLWAGANRWSWAGVKWWWPNLWAGVNSVISLTAVREWTILRIMVTITSGGDWVSTCGGDCGTVNYKFKYVACIGLGNLDSHYCCLVVFGLTNWSTWLSVWSTHMFVHTCEALKLVAIHCIGKLAWLVTLRKRIHGRDSFGGRKSWGWRALEKCPNSIMYARQLIPPPYFATLWFCPPLKLHRTFQGFERENFGYM